MYVRRQTLLRSVSPIEQNSVTYNFRHYLTSTNSPASVCQPGALDIQSNPQASDSGTKRRRGEREEGMEVL